MGIINFLDCCKSNIKKIVCSVDLKKIFYKNANNKR